MSEQSIFLNALELRDDARANYLAEACAENEALRREILTLLAAHERAGIFLDDPAIEQIARKIPTGEQNTVTIGETPHSGDTTATGSKPGRPDQFLQFLSPSTRSDSLGRIAHYEVLERIGAGAFGTVLKAFDERLHRVVAIKVLAPQLAASGTARARFLREARSAAAVRNDHVVSIHAVDESPFPFLVMECISGQTLQQKLDRSGPLSVPEILRIGQQIAKGLAAAHANGLVHRDIKPSNILLENGVERVKISDFGLARAVDDASLSQSGMVAGTPMYMSPEQAQGSSVDHRSDLFSLGSVLYTLCTGRPPFRASTTVAVLKRVVEAEPRPIREISPEMPEWLCRMIAKLHEKRPEDRFQSASEAADILGDCLRQLQTFGEIEDYSRIPGGEPAVAVTPAKTTKTVKVQSSRPQLAFPIVLIGSFLFLQIAQWQGRTRLKMDIPRWLDVIEFSALFVGIITAGLWWSGYASRANERHAGGYWILATVLVAMTSAAVALGTVLVRLDDSGSSVFWGFWLLSAAIVMGAVFIVIGFRSLTPFQTLDITESRKLIVGVVFACLMVALARASVVETFLGRVKLTTSDDEVLVYRNEDEKQMRRFIGKADREIYLLPGRYSIRSIRNGQEIYRKDLQITATRTESISVPSAGVVTIHQTFADVVFTVDGEEIPRTKREATRRSYPIGEHTWMAVDASGTEVAGGRFFLKAGDEIDLMVPKKSVASAAPDPISQIVFPDPGILSQYADRIGKSFRFDVVGTTDGPVWGTALHTLDSRLAAAVVHVGKLKMGQRGIVQVSILPGQKEYKGSTRNGVTSQDRGPAGASLRIDRVIPPDSETSLFAGTLAAFRDQIGKTFNVEVRGVNGLVWGTDVYTDHSQLGPAAVHAGVVKLGERAKVRVTILAGRDKFVGSTRNGIASQDLGTHPGSFRVEAVAPAEPSKEPPDSAPDLAVIQGLRELVAAKEESYRLVKIRLDAGLVPPQDAIRSHSEVIDALIRLAEAERRHSLVVTLIEEELKLLQDLKSLTEKRVKAGVARSDEVDACDTRIAEAKVRLAERRAKAPGQKPEMGPVPRETPTKK